MTNFPELATIEASRIQREAMATPKMTIYEATMIAEGCAEQVGYDPDDVELRRDAWQLLIDAGTCWQLQGWFGRQAVALIEAGECTR